jgi:hypothetical protein
MSSNPPPVDPPYNNMLPCSCFTSLTFCHGAYWIKQDMLLTGLKPTRSTSRCHLLPKTHQDENGGDNNNDDLEDRMEDG